MMKPTGVPSLGPITHSGMQDMAVHIGIPLASVTLRWKVRVGQSVYAPPNTTNQLRLCTVIVNPKAIYVCENWKKIAIIANILDFVFSVAFALTILAAYHVARPCVL